MQKTVKALTQTPLSLMLMTAAIMVILYKHVGGATGLVVLLPKQALTALALGLGIAAFRLTKRHEFVIPADDKTFTMRFTIVKFLGYGVVALITLAFGLMIFTPQSDIFGISPEAVIRLSACVIIISFVAAFPIGLMRMAVLKKYGHALLKDGRSI